MNHRYTLPGNFTAYLTVTDTDGLTNRASRLIQVAAPKPVVSVRLFNKHSGISKQAITEVKAVIPADPIQLTSLGEDLNIWVPSGIYSTTSTRHDPSPGRHRSAVPGWTPPMGCTPPRACRTGKPWPW